MKQKEVFKKIGGIISELNDQYEFLQTAAGDLNELEVEIFVANAHFLADHAEILYKLTLQNKISEAPAEEIKKSNEPKYFEPVVQQMRHGTGATEQKSAHTYSKPIEIAENTPQEDKPVPQIDLTSESAEDTYSFIREEPETIRHELILDEDQNWDVDYTIPENEELEDEEEVKTDPVSSPDTSASRQDIEKTRATESKPNAEVQNKATGDEVITINQKISSQLGNTVTGITEQQNVKPVSDIKLAITLNDKLLFVKELFNGYNLAYSEAIEILNRFNTFDEAMRFLNTNYIIKNDWDSKPETTEKFYSILRRRYA